MPSLAKRLSQVGVLSSIARRPRLPATSARAVSTSCCVSMSSLAFLAGCGGARAGRAVDDRLRFLQDPLQVLGAAEALGVDLVDGLGARRPRRVPAALRDDLDAADGGAVAGGVGEDALDLLAGKLTGAELLGRQRG